MSKVQRPKYERSKLNQNQITLLRLHYKYRFVSRQLIAETLSISPNNGLYERLEALVRWGYIGRRFEKSSKLQGVPVGYFILPKGIRYLEECGDRIAQNTIKSAYRDNAASITFVQHCMRVCKVAIKLQSLYPHIKVFTARDMLAYDYLPPTLPDLFLSLKSGDEADRFFVEVFPKDTPRIALDKKCASHLKYLEEGGWVITKSANPALLFVCDGGSLEKRAQKVLRKGLMESDEVVEAYTTSVDALDHASSKEIFSNVDDEDELVALA